MISLLSIVSKLLKRHICDLLLDHFDGLCGIHLSSGNTVLFTDDLLLHSRISQPSDFIALQKDVDELCNWLNNYTVSL